MVASRQYGSRHAMILGTQKIDGTFWVGELLKRTTTHFYSHNRA